MTDFSVTPHGAVLVRNCGCTKPGKGGHLHGPVSFWTDHSEEWQRANAIHARRVIGEFRDRWPERAEAMDSADALLRKSERKDI